VEVLPESDGDLVHGVGVAPLARGCFRGRDGPPASQVLPGSWRGSPKEDGRECEADIERVFFFSSIEAIVELFALTPR
jgi:hypothetical protein